MHKNTYLNQNSKKMPIKIPITGWAEKMERLCKVFSQSKLDQKISILSQKDTELYQNFISHVIFKITMSKFFATVKILEVTKIITAHERTA